MEEFYAKMRDRGRLDRFLEALSDGEWHNVPELCKSLNISENLMHKLIDSFVRIGLMEYDKDLKRVRAEKDFAALLRET